MNNHAEIRRETRLVWALVWPIILTNLLNVAVGIADFKMVGSLGVGAIGAVGMARQVMMFLMVLMIAISGGSSVLVAHAHGARDLAKVGDITAKSMALMLFAALFVVTPGGLLCSRPILALLGTPANIMDTSVNYLSILFLGSAFTMFNIGVSGILLGVGKTRVSLYLLFVVNLLNIVFNYLLIHGIGPFPRMGVAGAALGTIIARVLGSLAGVWILATPRLPIQARLLQGRRIDLDLTRRILYLGGPRSLQGVVRNFSRLMTLAIINLLPEPEQAVATYSVAMHIHLVSSFIGLAFMSAAMSRVGQNLGRGDRRAAEHSGWICATIAAAMMSVAALVFFFLPEQIMGFFTDDREVIRLGRVFFMIVALSEPAMAFAFALGGALRGGGDPMPPFIYASVSDLVVVILSGYLLAITCGMGFSGIAVAIAIAALTRAIPTTVTYARGNWKTKRV